MTKTVTQQSIEAFRDLFLLNPEIQARMKDVPHDQFIANATSIAKEFNFTFEESDLREFIDNFDETGEGDSPICILMGQAAQIPYPSGSIQFVLDELSKPDGTGVCKPW